MIRSMHVFLLVLLSLPSFSGATIMDTIVLEKELANGSKKRVVFWGDIHFFHKRAIQEQVKAFDEIIDHINIVSVTSNNPKEEAHICDGSDCYSGIGPVTILHEQLPLFGDSDDFDLECYRCSASLRWKIDFSKNDREALLSFIKKSSFEGLSPLNLDQTNAANEDDNYGFRFDKGRINGIMKRLYELSEEADSDPSLTIKPVDPRRVGILTLVRALLHRGGFLGDQFRVDDDRLVPKESGTCANTSITLSEMLNEVKREFDLGLRAAQSLIPYMQDEGSANEIYSQAQAVLGIVDALTQLHNIVDRIAVLRDSTLAKLIQIFKDRLNGVPQEKTEKPSDLLTVVLPECNAIHDQLTMILSFLGQALMEGLIVVGSWQIEANIISHVLSSNSSVLLLVSAGAAHALQCADLLSNEGYEVIFSTIPFADKAMRQLYLTYFPQPVLTGALDLVDGTTLKATVLGSRIALKELQESPGSLYKASEDFMKRLIGGEDPGLSDYVKSALYEEPSSFEDGVAQKDEL